MRKYLLFYFKFIIKNNSFEIAILPDNNFFASLVFSRFLKINIFICSIQVGIYITCSYDYTMYV